MQDRILVSIAVSSPEQLPPLPGALNASRRMSRWAAASGYHVVEITDAPDTRGRPRVVDVDRVREEVRAAIEAIQSRTPLARLIVFFAGHGGAKGPNEAFWLLSRWWSRPTEAIHLLALERMLRFYGPRQVSLIGDACQIHNDDMIETNGSAVLDRRDKDPTIFELDQFFAADVTERAFMIAENDNEPFCIYTEVMLDALEGDATDAYEPDGTGGRVVTSGSLTQHLLREIPREAGRYDLTMNARPRPGFHTDRIYARFPGVPASVEPTAPRPVTPVVEDLQRRARDEAERREREAERRERRRERVRSELLEAQATPAHLPSSIRPIALEVIGLDVDAVETSEGGEAVEASRGLFAIEGAERRPVEVAVSSGDMRVYVCMVPNHGTAIASTGEGLVVLHRPAWWPQGQPDLVADVLARLQVGGLDASATADLATILRRSKHANPVLGCIASYLYASIGDVEGVRSIAAYYAMRSEDVPLDVALLTGSPLRMEGDGLLLDLPEVLGRDPRTRIEAEHSFSHDGTPAMSGVRIAGRLPWLSAGWRLLDSTPIEPSAAEWLETTLGLAHHLLPGNFTALDADATEPLRSALSLRTAELFA